MPNFWKRSRRIFFETAFGFTKKIINTRMHKFDTSVLWLYHFFQWLKPIIFMTRTSEHCKKNIWKTQTAVLPNRTSEKQIQFLLLNTLVEKKRYLARSLQDTLQNLARYCIILESILQDTHQSCKNLARNTKMFQESCKKYIMLAKDLQELYESCKNLHETNEFCKNLEKVV